MFSNLYKYWYNVTDTPSVLFKINIWTYVNIRYFKLKFSRTLIYFTVGLKSLKLNEIKLFYKDWIFENFFENFFKYFVIIILLMLIF